MDFTGRVYFSFGEADVYRFYRLLVGAAAEGTNVRVEWVGIAPGGVPDGPMVGDSLATAIAEELRQGDEPCHAGYIQALLTAVHSEGIDLAHPGLIQLALERAGCDPGTLLTAAHAPSLRATLEASTAAAGELGVTGVPAVYRHGPVLWIRTTGALATGRATDRLRVVAAVMEDDGIWELRKP